jgi:sporulation protein YlmC with PRC-barrel domain
MLHKHTKAILMASCIAFAPAYALAQTQQGQTTQPRMNQQHMDQQRTGERPMDQQRMGQPQMGQQHMDQQRMGQQQMGQRPMGQRQAMQPLAAPQPGQMMGSDLRGTTIYGANNENIGEIDDILIDRQGQVVAVIVGVGGFLGIGEKDVAIPFQSLDIVNAQVTAGARAPLTTGTTPGVRATDQERQRATAEQAGEPRTAPGTRTTADEQGTMRPERIVLRGMTKADLEAAPEFRSEAR